MADLGGGQGGPGGGGNGFGPVLKGGPAGGGGNLLAGRPKILGEGGNENLYPPLLESIYLRGLTKFHSAFATFVGQLESRRKRRPLEMSTGITKRDITYEYWRVRIKLK